MNYFAHGITSLDRPWVLAGTALPDWLRVADRRARIRDGDSSRWPGTSGRELALGVRLHLAEDAVFHDSPTFVELCRRVTLDLRAQAGSKRLRSSVVAHVLVEMLLDSWLGQAEPGSLLRYYEAMERVPRDELIAMIAHSHGEDVGRRLGASQARFLKTRFLHGYASDEGLLRSLHGVIERVPLGQLPDTFVDRLTRYREWVSQAASRLMHEVRP